MKAKKINFVRFIALVLFAAGSACSQMPQGNPDNGERWYRLNRCNGCHGEKGIGGKGVGTKGPPLAGLTLSSKQFIKKIRTPNSGIMPAYEAERLSDQDTADIYAWLKLQKLQ